MTLQSVYVGSSCSWDGKTCDDGAFVQEHTKLGLCYTFNPGLNGTLMSNRTGQHVDITFAFKILFCFLVYACEITSHIGTEFDVQ